MTSTSTSWLVPRRRALAAIGSAVILGLTVAPSGTAAAAPAAAGRGAFLVAADAAAGAVHVLRASDLRRTGSLDDLDVDVHAGTVPLPDGRVILADEHGTVHAVRLDRAGRPRIERSVAIPTAGRTWAGAAWAAVDPSLRYYGITSAYEDSADQSVTVVDLHTFAVRQLPVEVDRVGGAYTEVQVTFGGRPTQIVTAAGGKFRTFPLADVLAGRVPAATSSAPLGDGNHGPLGSRRGDRHFSTTADGVDGVALPATTLVGRTSVAYSATRAIVQNYRPRWGADDRTVWGSVAEDTGLAPEQWAEQRNHVHTLDTSTARSGLTKLPDGLPGRLALSARYAAVTTASPQGDVTTLIDADPRSATYRRVVGTVALAPLAKGPVEGRPPAGAETRATAITPDGAKAFVTSGGEGRITAIDTRTRSVHRTARVPTPLTAGGHLTVVQFGAPVTDLVAR
ncbi:hypothetical protein [Jidongwangia harbinensis]|uniref:hypothetical protein n=1 Tax=Jidongwangia harbinensis TaxID=2878561 RepID=UPI001CDA05E3|nr:hypothetical protein [Jidongwangia harbinensis]MCA2211614.1 hypothetical protein [Jidongwangia harbinensis]